MSQEKTKLSELFPIASYDDWRTAAELALGGVPFEKKLITKTYENIDLQPIYDDAMANNAAKATIANLPGEYPFARAINHLGFKINPWEIAQEVNVPLPDQFNKAIIHDLYRGQDAISIKLNENFAVNPNAKNASPDEGLLIANADDLAAALKGIDLKAVSLRFKSNSLGLELAAMVLNYLQKNDFDSSAIRFSLGLSPLNQLIITGKSSISISKLFDDAELLIRWKAENNASARIISINAETYLNAGSSSTEDIAFAIAEGTHIIRELLHRGLEIDQIAQSIDFEFAIGPKFFTEISKFRAARMLWAKVVKEFGGNEESQKMILHTATSKMNKTKFDPHVNLLRDTTEALSAVLGGANSISIAGYDEFHGVSGETSRRIARNIQSVILHEAHINDTIDPAGGSWYLEVLTNQIAEKAWDLFRQVEALGGILPALKQGFIQNDCIAKTASARKSNIASRRDTLLGTNKYPNLNEKPVDSVININADDLKQFADRFAEDCQNAKCQNAVKEYRSVFMSDRNKSLQKAMAAFNECTTISKLLAATGAINSDVIKVSPIVPFRMGTIFEELRDAANQYKLDNSKAPQICLVNLGLLKEYKGRNDFATDFFQVAGFELFNLEGAADAAAAIENIKSTEFPAYVICSTDDKYAEMVPTLAKEFKTLKPKAKLILAGYPTDMINTYTEAGIDDFIHIKTNIYDFLSALMKEIGILV